ncbi:MAG: Gfo/Idh/MocA family oxidoreductase [Planctomycetes bacterium]|nr:Gfo/Idh/MocA family oxidoreductase [Planctomycetota bacterium]
MQALRVLVVGCGNMGTSHARAYAALEGFEIVGLVSRGAESRDRLAREVGQPATFASFTEALATTKPDVVSINTYPETHYDYCKASLEAGCHVFLEKPIANTVHEATELVELAKARGRKLVIGYILRVHPAWQQFVELARGLGKPLVLRMNLNQQSRGPEWETHKSLMKTMSPIVDCGVHYVDVMCQMTRSRPVRVSAIGARLTEEVAADMYNYGQLQVTFEDGSVGWYEAGWGPMMSETAFFVKDVIGPLGCVSIVDRKGAERAKDSAKVDDHVTTSSLKVHYAERDDHGAFVRKDEFVDTSDEPDHDELCKREQAFLLDAIREDRDLTEHMQDAIESLRIVLAADESVRSGRTIDL